MCLDRTINFSIISKLAKYRMFEIMCETLFRSSSLDARKAECIVVKPRAKKYKGVV